jgi:hypothetical protein
MGDLSKHSVSMTGIVVRNEGRVLGPFSGGTTGGGSRPV